MCSALEHSGIDTIWETMETYQRDMSENGEIFHKRKRQRSHWMWHQLQDEVRSRSLDAIFCQKKVSNHDTS